MMNETLCPFDSICSTMVFASKDWSLDKSDAWIYGIVVGWDSDALAELKQKFKWSEETVNRLQKLHEAFLDSRALLLS